MCTGRPVSRPAPRRSLTCLKQRPLALCPLLLCLGSHLSPVQTLHSHLKPFLLVFFHCTPHSLHWRIYLYECSMSSTGRDTLYLPAQHTHSSGKDQCLRGKTLVLTTFRASWYFLFCLFFFLIVKYTQHKICHFKHFEAHSLVALSTFNLLENHHHQPSPELCHYPKWKLCFH